MGEISIWFDLIRSIVCFSFQLRQTIRRLLVCHGRCYIVGGLGSYHSARVHQLSPRATRDSIQLYCISIVSLPVMVTAAHKQDMLNDVSHHQGVNHYGGSGKRRGKGSAGSGGIRCTLCEYTHIASDLRLGSVSITSGEMNTTSDKLDVRVTNPSSHW